MIRISKVRWPEMGQDYGWLFEIRDYEELMQYWDAVRRPMSQNLFREGLKYAEGSAHANILATMAEMKGIGLINALTELNSNISKGMSSALDEFGTIFINDLGGYFAKIDGVLIDETREIDVWALPDKEPRFIKWEGGKHWYAKIGDEDIIVDGKQKWDTKPQAEAAAKRYMLGKRRR